MTARKTFLIASAFYFALALFFFPYLYCFGISPDTIAYLSIAKKYSSGDFTHAINGCWSPFISWLLAIPLALGCDAIKSFALLQLLIGWFALVQWMVMCRRNIFSITFQNVLIFTAVPSLLCFAWIELTPDLLLVAFTLFYLNIVSHKDFFLTKHYWLIAGMLGLFFYLIKSFGFYFFILHLFLISLHWFLKNKNRNFRKHILKNYTGGMLCFLLLSSSWIFMISKKYGHFTISEAATFNFSKETAPLPEQFIVMPILHEGITVPADSSSVIAWEDPTLVIQLTPLYPFAVKEDFNFYIQLINRNILTIYYYDFRRQTGIIFLLALILFLVIGGMRKIFGDTKLFILLSAFILFYAGYSLVLVHTRYVWINTLLLLLLTAVFIQHITTKSKVMKVTGNILFTLLILLAVKRPVKELFFSEDKATSVNQLSQIVFHPLNTLYETYSPQIKLRLAIEELTKEEIISGNIASFKTNSSPDNIYPQSAWLALYAGCKFYGQVDVALLSEEQKSILKRYNISYILSWDAEGRKSIEEKGWKPLYKNEAMNLCVYKAE